jgi:hypothetical protein
VFGFGLAIRQVSSFVALGRVCLIFSVHLRYSWLQSGLFDSEDLGLLVYEVDSSSTSKLACSFLV